MYMERNEIKKKILKITENTSKINTSFGFFLWNEK